MLLKPFLHHMAKQTPLGGFSRSQSPPSSHEAAAAPTQILPCLSCCSLGLSPSLIHSPCPTWSLPAPHSWGVGAQAPQGALSTSQPSLDEDGHSHEPPRTPDSALLSEKYLSSPKRPCSPHQLTPHLGPGHRQHSKGQLLQSREVARLLRKLWLSSHLLCPGINPARRVSCQTSL